MIGIVHSKVKEKNFRWRNNVVNIAFRNDIAVRKLNLGKKNVLFSIFTSIPRKMFFIAKIGIITESDNNACYVNEFSIRLNNDASKSIKQINDDINKVM